VANLDQWDEYINSNGYRVTRFLLPGDYLKDNMLSASSADSTRGIRIVGTAFPASTTCCIINVTMPVLYTPSETLYNLVAK